MNKIKKSNGRIIIPDNYVRADKNSLVGLATCICLRACQITKFVTTVTVSSWCLIVCKGQVLVTATFIELLADTSGLPIGIKSAIGKLEFWKELAQRIEDRNQGPDFIAIDGGEGGTGAAPLAFADHVSLPFKIGFKRIYTIFQYQEKQGYGCCRIMCR